MKFYLQQDTKIIKLEKLGVIILEVFILLNFAQTVIVQDIALPSYALDSQLSQVQQFGEFTILPLFVFHKSGLFSKCTAFSRMLM